MDDLENSSESSPGTSPGPNDHLTLQQPAFNPAQASATGPIFKIKERVIDMKQLEALKKRLPNGIDLRILSDGTIKFRARFRKNGYPKQIKIFSELKLAKHWLEEQNRNALLNIYMPGLAAKKKTLSDVIDLYIKTVLPLKPKNAKNTIQHLEWWRKELGEYSISAIRPQLIGEKRDLLASEPIRNDKRRTSTTVVRYLSSLSHLFAVAYREWDLITDNPVKKVSKPRVNPPRVRYLSKDEFKRLLDAAAVSRCKDLLTIVSIALSTGMRYKEILSLRWEDIDIKEQVIKLKTTKNGDPRHLPLKGKTLKLVIQKAMDRQHASSLLFPSPNNPLKPYDIRTAWEFALKKAEIKDFHFHGLRHTTASYLIMSGKGLHDVASILGHKSLQSTRQYAHLSNEYKSKMVEDLDHEFFGTA